MYKIIWDFIDLSGYCHKNNEVEFDNKNDANEAWVAMKKNPCFVNMQAITTDDKYIAVTVTFQNYNKDYTYLSKKPIKTKYCVVNTSEGYKVVKVKKCYETTKAELEKALPFDSYKYVVGIVKEV